MIIDLRRGTLHTYPSYAHGIVTLAPVTWTQTILAVGPVTISASATAPAIGATALAPTISASATRPTISVSGSVEVL